MEEATKSSELLPSACLSERYSLKGDDEPIYFTDGRNVVVLLDQEESHRETDSARVHTKNIADFKGETRSFPGRVLAVQGDLIACHLYFEATGHVVRIIHSQTRSRHLIKNFAQPPVDVQFATHAPLLAVVDTKSSLIIYKVGTNCENVECVMSITDWPSGEGMPKVSWCPYVPESEDDDDCHMLAVFRGNEVTLVNISNLLAESQGNTQLTYAAAQNYAEVIMRVTVEDPVTSVRISPDSTALGIVTSTGFVRFYILGDGQLKLAQLWQPAVKTPMLDLYFLDPLEKNNKSDEPERFWRQCLVVGEGGRDLTLFECERWTCQGHLCVETPLEAPACRVFLDPLAHFVYLVDTDANNIFCVELARQSLRFLSITQVTFCHAIVSAVPYGISYDTDGDDNNDAGLEDTRESGSMGVAKAHFVCLGAKQLAQLSIDLALAEETVVPPLVPDLVQTNDSRETSHNSTQKPDSLPALEVSVSPVAGTSYSSQSQSHQRQSTPRTGSVSQGGAPGETSTTMDRAELDHRFAELAQKLDTVCYRLDRFDQDRRLGADDNMVVEMLHTYRSELTARENRLVAEVNELMESSRNLTVSAVRNALTENGVVLENVVQSVSQQSAEAAAGRVSDRLQEALVAAVVPAIERICSQLFKQLNETYRQGMEQYMTQFRSLHAATVAAVAASATPAPSVSVTSDRQGLVQLIKNRQTPLAFETVLNQGDSTSLEFLCNQVDPDEFFNYQGGQLSQPVLLSLLQQLSLGLETDTDLKFRYFEHILELIHTNDTSTSALVPNVLTGVNNALSELQAVTTNQSIKRQARMLGQLIRTIAKS